jgi:uncharacterized membrane protein YoaK (UPF0700 family)
VQSRAWSFAEAFTGVAVGYVTGLATQLVAFPLVGLHATLAQSLAVSLFFTVVGLARTYVIRRFFNRINPRPQEGPSCD